MIGPNGAGKTTALNAILGLTSYDGQLSCSSRPVDGARTTDGDVSFIADVAVLPRWIRFRVCSTTSQVCIRG